MYKYKCMYVCSYDTIDIENVFMYLRGKGLTREEGSFVCSLVLVAHKKILCV